MKKFAFVLALSAACAGLAVAEETPTLFGAAPGGPPIGSDREVCWSEPGDETQNIGSSEVIGAFALETEIANDFFFTSDQTITLARWWGGYWNGTPIPTNSNLRFYDDAGCIPGAVLAEYLNVEDNETPVGAVYVYSYGLSFPASANTLYWFSAQYADHAFPPQCGRLSTSIETSCPSVFRSVYFAYPDWTPAADVFGAFFEASQEFECGVTANTETTWGAIKGLYR